MSVSTRGSFALLGVLGFADGVQGMAPRPCRLSWHGTLGSLIRECFPFEQEQRGDARVTHKRAGDFRTRETLEELRFVGGTPGSFRTVTLP